MQNRLVFFLIVIAVILAIAGFLLVSFLTRDPQASADLPAEQPAADVGEVPVGIPVQVDDTTVYLQTLPEKSVRLQSNAAPSLAEPTPSGVQPTSEPTQPLVVATIPPTTAAAPAPATSAQAVIFIDYVVQPEDTLYRITEKQTTSIELMAVHGISSEDIVPGATLRLPVANPAFCSAGGRQYVVRPGDTVFSIANRFNTTTQAIAAANSLGADFRIDVAQVLCIP